MTRDILATEQMESDIGDFCSSPLLHKIIAADYNFTWLNDILEGTGVLSVLLFGPTKHIKN